MTTNHLISSFLYSCYLQNPLSSYDCQKCFNSIKCENLAQTTHQLFGLSGLKYQLRTSMRQSTPFNQSDQFYIFSHSRCCPYYFPFYFNFSNHFGTHNPLIFALFNLRWLRYGQIGIFCDFSRKFIKNQLSTGSFVLMLGRFGFFMLILKKNGEKNNKMIFIIN